MEECSRGPTGQPAGTVDAALAAHEGLVRWVVRRQQRGALSLADARHAGRLGLWRAVLGYDEQRGTRFSTYAVPAIRRAVWRAVAEATPDRAPDGEVGPEPVWWEDPVDAVHRAAVGAAVRALVAELPPGPRRIVVAHHGLDGGRPVSLAQLGRERGVSRQRVHAVYQAALVFLAQPERSRAVRALVDRQTRAEYQRTLARARRLARAREAAMATLTALALPIVPTHPTPRPAPDGPTVRPPSAAQKRAQQPDLAATWSLAALTPSLPLVFPVDPDLPPSPKLSYRSQYQPPDPARVPDPATWEHRSDFELALAVIDFTPLERLLATMYRPSAKG